jgi:hypothetical protein
VGERRLNQATMASLEGEGIWKPLGQFAEFADLFAAGVGAPAVASGGIYSADPAAARAAALKQVKVPALIMTIVAIVSILAFVANLAVAATGRDPGRAMIEAFGINLPQPPPEQVEMQKKLVLPMAVGQLVIGTIWNAFVIFGASRMKQLRSPGLAMTAAILATIPCCSFCCTSLPFGIWALVVLAKTEVKSQFTP